MRWPRARAGEVRAPDGPHLADRAAAHQIAAEVVDGARSLLSSRLEHRPILLFGADQILPFLDRQGEWLLRVHVEAGLHGVDAGRHAGVGRRGDEHAVEPDLERRQVVQRMALEHAWLGLLWHPDGTRLLSSGAADNSVLEVEWRGGKLVPGRTLVLAPPQRGGRPEAMENPGFVGGLALATDAKVLYAAQVYGKAVAAVDVETGAVLARASLPAEAYAAAVPRDGSAVYVSVWGGARVAVLEPRTLRPLAEIAVGEHPNAMAFSKDEKRLFVACANTNAVWVVDLEARRAVERIGVALSPTAPPGSTPNALALSPDGATLLVANADNNTVAVVDVTRPGESRFRGFVPTGWYPTGVLFDPRGERILVLSGKGLAGAANQASRTRARSVRGDTGLRELHGSRQLRGHVLLPRGGTAGQRPPTRLALGLLAALPVAFGRCLI